MILMWVNPNEGNWKVSPENRDFLGPEMATSGEEAIWAQKGRDFQGKRYEVNSLVPLTLRTATPPPPFPYKYLHSGMGGVGGLSLPLHPYSPLYRTNKTSRAIIKVLYIWHASGTYIFEWHYGEHLKVPGIELLTAEAGDQARLTRLEVGHLKIMRRMTTTS